MDDEINHLLKIDKRIFQKMFTDHLDKNTNLNHEAKAILDSSSPSQPAHNILGIFAECSLSVAMFGTSKEI